MRKRIKVTGFKDWDSMFYNNLLSIPVLIVFSLLVEDWSAASFSRNLSVDFPSSPVIVSARRRRSVHLETSVHQTSCAQTFRKTSTLSPAPQWITS